MAKFRADFVTNSSSSSFIVVGVDLNKWKDIFPMDPNFRYEINSPILEVIPSNKDGIFITLRTDMVNTLIMNHGVNHIMELFVVWVKEFHNIDVPIEDVKFAYGEYFNG